jgi:EmrB/QacA subfamily drug resistance transporter
MTDRIRALAPTESNRRWWTLGAMCFALFMIMLDNTVVNVALPSIQRDLHASLSSLEWTINAYTLTFAVLLVTGGRLGDIFGRRRMFLFGVVTFALSSAAIGLAPSDAWLIAGRAVQGIGAAFMMPATLSIISNAFPPNERGKAIGTWAGVSAIALAIGPLVGGWMVEHVGWQAIFFINIPVAVLAVVVTLWAAHESRDDTAERTVDIPGVLSIGTGIGALVLALVEGNSWGWGSVSVLALFAVSALSIVAFAIVERRVKNPMLDFSYFRSRTFLGANLVAFMVTFAMFGMFLFIALYMQNVLHYSPLEAGVRFLPTTLVVMVLGPVAGRLSDRVGPRPLLVGGLITVAIALFWQSFIQVDTSFDFLLPAFILMGAGIAFVMSPMSTAAMNAVDRRKAGAASGVLSMTRMVGGTLGVAVIGALVSIIGRSRLETLLPYAKPAQLDRLSDALGSAGAAHAPHHVVAAMNDAYVFALDDALKVSAGAALLGAVMAWFLIAKRTGPATEHEPVVLDASAISPAAEQAEAAEREPAPEPARA